MANIVMTTTVDRVDVLFNEYSTQLDMVDGSWSRRHILSVRNKTDYVVINILGEKEWRVSFDGSDGSLQIDLVDTVAPISNSDLCDKLRVLIK